MFNQFAFSTTQYERAAKTATGTILPGCAIKRPTAPASGSVLTVAPAGAADRPVAVASAMDPSVNITTTGGRAVFLGGSPYVAVRLESAVVEGDQLCVKSSTGTWGKVGMTDTPVVEAMEGGSMGDLIWASVL